MSVHKQLQADMKQAMKQREKEKLAVIRYVLGEVQKAEIEAQEDLSNEQVMEVLEQEVKKRKKAIEQYREAGRDDLVEHEIAQLQIIEVYLPEKMSEAEIERVVDDVIQEVDEVSMGSVMSEVLSRVGKDADSALVAKIVKQKLFS